MGDMAVQTLWAPAHCSLPPAPPFTLQVMPRSGFCLFFFFIGGWLYFCRAAITHGHKVSGLTLKQQKCILPVVEAGNLQSRRGQGCAPSKGFGRILPCLSLAHGSLA